MIEIDPRTRALIFDIDGTLADTMMLHYAAWQDLAAEWGFVYPIEVFYEFAGVPTPNIVLKLNERFGYNLDPVLTVKEKEDRMFKLMHKIKPIMPVYETAEFYKGKLPMGIGTGGRREMAVKTLEAIGMGQDYFDAFVCAEDVKNHKPAPDTFLMCAELMKIDPSVCEVFEDGEGGLAAARTAGMIATDIRPYLE